MQPLNRIHGGGKHMKIKFLGLVVLLALLAGCADAVPSLPAPDGENRERRATVESVEVVMLTSFPLQVHLHVNGYLGDPCTEIDEIQTQRDGFTFEVLIKTMRDTSLDCIQVIEPFEENIPLDVYGLPSGDYQVVVNGVEAEFTFFQDNILGE
jgi:inhibitor of cysteine peptidase